CKTRTFALGDKPHSFFAPEGKPPWRGLNSRPLSHVVLNKKRDGKNVDDKHKDSLKYPPGFTPNEDGDVPVEKVDNWSDENRVYDGQEDGVCVGQHVHERVEVSNDTHESTCSGHFKKSEVPRKGGSIL
nr:hypothetical protein [Tanacetum cinerariifolium]